MTTVPATTACGDLSILQVVPGLRIAAPRDGARVAELLNEAVQVNDAPTVLRFPKGPVFDDIEAVGKAGGCDVLAKPGLTASKDVLIVGIGSMAVTAVDVGSRLTAHGFGVTVVDPRWIKPVDPAIVSLAAEHRCVVTMEDNGRVGGCGSAIAQALRDAGVSTPLHDFGVPQEFLAHAKRAAILERIGLTAQDLALAVTERLAADDAAAQQPHSQPSV